MTEFTKDEFDNGFERTRCGILSSVLKSERAIQVNIQIIRAFTQLRKMLSTHKDLIPKLEEMESKYDKQFSVVFEAIRQLLDTENKPKRKIPS